ncbi:MAG: hypothetical protein GY953_19820, partial [bacterium]|nr:hypothetical protein [bacterium]
RIDLPFSFHLEWALKTGGDFLRVAGLFRHRTPDPASIYTAGSWPNMNELIRRNEKLQQLIRETIRDKRCLDPEIFDIGALEAHLEEHLRGRDLNELLLSLLTFGRWYKKYGP